MYNIPNTFDAYANRPGTQYNPYSTKLEISRNPTANNEEFYYEDGLPGNHYNKRTCVILLSDLLWFCLCAVAFVELAQIHEAWYLLSVVFLLGTLWSLYNLCLVCSGKVVGKARILILTKYLAFRTLAIFTGIGSTASFIWFMWEIHRGGKHDHETKHLKFIQKMSYFYLTVGGAFLSMALYLRCSQAAFSHAVKRWTTFNKYQNLTN